MFIAYVILRWWRVHKGVIFVYVCIKKYHNKIERAWREKKSKKINSRCPNASAACTYTMHDYDIIIYWRRSRKDVRCNSATARPMAKIHVNIICAGKLYVIIDRVTLWAFSPLICWIVAFRYFYIEDCQDFPRNSSRLARFYRKKKNSSMTKILTRR